MAKRVIIDSEAANSSVSSLKDIQAQIAELERKAKEEKERLRKEKALLKEQEKAAKKQAKEGGVIASIVSVLADYAVSGKGLSYPQRIAKAYELGKNKEEILSLLLAKLGKSQDSEDAPLHAATIGVQLGKRIFPRLEAKGLSLCSVKADKAKYSLYLAFIENPEKLGRQEKPTEKPSEEKPSVIVRKKAENA